jgi:hypothetical protein
LLTIILTVVIFVCIFFLIGFVGMVKQQREKSRPPIERKDIPLRVRNPLIFKILNLGSLFAMVVISYATASYLLKSPTELKGPSPSESGQKAKIATPKQTEVTAVDPSTPARQLHDAAASDVDDVVRTMGYDAHVFPGTDSDDLTVISKVLSEGQDHELFLSLLRGRWKQELCASGYGKVTFKSSVLSSGSSFPLFC